MGAVCAAALACSAAAGSSDQPITPFNGTSLDGWTGDRQVWTVEDGAIVGRTTADRPIEASAYLSWDGDMPADFRLRCEFMITGGNSGIHYRSRRVGGQPDMAGFQADLDAENAHTGTLYEGLGRGIMSVRGERTEWTHDGKRVNGTFAADSDIRGTMRPGEWNEYVIEAQGTRTRHWINGILMSDVADGDATRFKPDGLLGFQVHHGPPMEVRFRGIEVTPLREAPPAGSISVPKGFEVSRIASAQPGQGSWVAIEFDRRGRAIISPQSGPLLCAEIPGVTAGMDAGDIRISQLNGLPGSAQGLCAVGDDLWVNSAAPGPDAGLWRLQDKDGDGRWEHRTRVLTWQGNGGEHGPHAVVEGADGGLYVAVGNHTPVPREVRRGACDRWGEDAVGRVMPDPRGHAVGIAAPGGTVIRVDPESGDAELWATGFRNHYDIAVAPDGELFTYDSDMEWDMGAPWYRAPRIVHVVRGGEYGWRTGSGKWPSWYPDSLPPVCDTDASSPTGMLHGAAGSFPPPWNGRLFAADWSYGRILAVDLEPSGGSFTGRWSTFATGRPMPVADMAWGPDGAMYIVTGGRGTQSGLYRIGAIGAGRPTGTTPDASGAAARERDTPASVRRAIERDMTSEDRGDSRELALSALASDDRAVAFAARVALEQMGPEAIARAMASTSVRTRAMAALAAARCSEIDAMRTIDLVTGDPEITTADPWTRLVGIRAIAICIARHRAQATELTLRAWPALAALCDDTDPRISELALDVACAIGAPGSVEGALTRLESAENRADALRWATMLRTVKDGWTEDQRARFWRALNTVNADAGGFSLAGFISAVRADAQASVGAAPAEPAAPSAANGTAGRGRAPARRPPRAWTVDALMTPAARDGTQRDLARGARVFAEAMCDRCHRVAGTGGSTGPDLTGAGARFTRRDLLRAILEPSADVSDQYRDSAVTRTDGDVVVGRIVARTPDHIEMMTDPYSPATVRIPAGDVASVEEVPTSSMPAGLLSAHTRAEILDLLAYLESAPGSTR